MRYLTTIMTHHWKFFSFTNPMFNQASVFKCDRTLFNDIDSYVKYMFLINIKPPVTSPKFNTSKFEEFNELCQHLMILDDVIINMLNTDHNSVNSSVDSSVDSTTDSSAENNKHIDNTVSDMIATARANVANKTNEFVNNSNYKKGKLNCKNR